MRVKARRKELRKFVLDMNDTHTLAFRHQQMLANMPRARVDPDLLGLAMIKKYKEHFERISAVKLM